MESFSINFLAVVVVAIGKNLLGGLWFSPLLFEKAMCDLSGTSVETMRRGMPRKIAIELVGNLVLAFAFLHAVHYSGATTLAQGAVVGFLNWFGFVAVTTFAAVNWSGQPFKLWAISNAIFLITLMIMGAVLAVWV
jgi:hypothetical protein